MKSTVWIYVGLTVVFILSVGTSLVFPVESVLGKVASLPAIGALIVALFQFIRDQAAFDKQQFLQRQQESFTLGTTSHMANVAFDKHVEFCEKYMSEVHGTVATLFRQGPTQDALQHARRFAELKNEFAAWLPRDVVLDLEPFENAVNKIGALSDLVDALQGSDQPGRPTAIQEMYDIFREVMQIGENVPIEKQPETAVEVVKEHVRAMLGIEELTKLRRKLVKRALSSLNTDD